MSSALRIVIYSTSTGKEPFNDWLDGLDNSIRGIIMARIDRLAKGHPGNVKALKNGLFELKLPAGPGYRIYFAEFSKQLVLLISGGDKSTQKSDIKKAKAFLEDYKERT